MLRHTDLERGHLEYEIYIINSLIRSDKESLTQEDDRINWHLRGHMNGRMIIKRRVPNPPSCIISTYTHGNLHTWLNLRLA